jgi:hypothetical protein
MLIHLFQSGSRALEELLDLLQIRAEPIEGCRRGV